MQSTPGQGQRLGLGLWSGVRVRVRGRVKGRVRVRVRGRVRGTVRVRVVWVQSAPERRSTSAISILAGAPLYYCYIYTSRSAALLVLCLYWPKRRFTSAISILAEAPLRRERPP